MLALVAIAVAAPAVYGYLPYWTVGEDEVPWAHLTHLAVFSSGVDASGQLDASAFSDAEVAGLVTRGRSEGVRMHLCVTQFDDDTLDALLSSRTARARLVADVAAAVAAHGYDGVNIDFEGVPEARRADMVAFTAELAAAVPDVWLAIPAVDWSDAWDVASLSSHANLFIMGYGYHWTGGGPGPNAPLRSGDEWSRYTLSWTVEQYLDQGAAPSRLTLGLPLYGQTWPVASEDEVPGEATDDGWSIPYADAIAAAERHGRRWDASTSTPWYAEGGRQTWYDDAESVAIKADYALVEAGLGGVGFWAIGYDARDPELWAGVDAAVSAASDTDPTDTDPSDTDPGDTDPADPRGRPGRATVVGESGCATAPGAAAVGWAALLVVAYASAARTSSWTRGGLAVPRVSFITSPTKNPSNPVFPPR